MDIKLFTTDDGSHSLYNPLLKETYHSSHGAVTESRHVFIKEGLQFFADHNSPREIKIFEVGFGTGLNALLSWMWAEANNIRIIYHSIEQYPISLAVAQEINYGKLLDVENKYLELHNAKWNVEVELSSFFKVKKIKAEWVNFKIEETCNLIFYDAFAPGKQPEMWDISLLQRCIEAIEAKGVIVSYCARGQFKRDLKEVGFTVETLLGPPGKKEMVRGSKL